MEFIYLKKKLSKGILFFAVLKHLDCIFYKEKLIGEKLKIIFLDVNKVFDRFHFEMLIYKFI